MDVLNTTGGGANVFAVIVGVVIIAISVIGMYIAMTEPEMLGFGFSVAMFFLCLVGAGLGLSVITVEEPIRHEVTLRTGHVIDATKYDVIEQRGSLYVIQEREEVSE